jgi:hypothetical protein
MSCLGVRAVRPRRATSASRQTNHIWPASARRLHGVQRRIRWKSVRSRSELSCNANCYAEIDKSYRSAHFPLLRASLIIICASSARVFFSLAIAFNSDARFRN